MNLSEERIELISQLGGIFPGATARTFSVPSKAIPPTTTVTVKNIGKQQLCDLAMVVTDLGFDIEMKRSGTGISIKFINQALELAGVRVPCLVQPGLVSARLHVLYRCVNHSLN